MSLPTPSGYYRAEAAYADLLRRVGLPDAMSVFEHPKIDAWRSITERENCVLDYDGDERRGTPAGRLHIKRNKAGHRGVDEEAAAIRGHRQGAAIAALDAQEDAVEVGAALFAMFHPHDHVAPEIGEFADLDRGAERP